MEPDAFNLPVGTTARSDTPDVALVSIAISLKRIADALHYQPAGDENIFDHIRTIARGGIR